MNKSPNDDERQAKDIDMVWFYFYIILENANKSIVTKPITDCLETRTARGVIKEHKETFAGGRYVHYLDWRGFMNVYICQMMHIHSNYV